MLGLGRSSGVKSTSTLPLCALGGVFLLLVLCGGSSRPDVLGLVLLRPGLLIALAVFLLLPQRMDLTGIRSLLVLLGLFAAWILIQLIPLPNGFWRLMPGHMAFSGADALVGPAPWRPISLVPEVTLNSAIALLAPAAVLVGLGMAGATAKRLAPITIVAIAVTGALLALVQVITGSGPIYTVSRPTASGLFANRNHQALLLAIAIPYAALWAGQTDRLRLPTLVRIVIAGGIIVFLAGVIVVTGSRAGLLLGLIGILSLPFVVPGRFWRLPHAKIIAAAALLVMMLFVTAIIYFDRAQSIDRLSAMQALAGEGRIEFLPITWSILKDFFPVGAGMSVFDPLYRAYEPDWALHVGYFNRAHNDWLDLVLGGGIIAAMLLGAFIFVMSCGLWSGISNPQRRGWAFAGGTALFQIAVASAVDYPLRTPLMAGILALVCVVVLAPPEPWMRPPRRR